MFINSTGGGWYMLSVQAFSCTCLFFWGLIVTYPILWIVNKITPIRLSPEDEIIGCDIIEHYMGDEKELIPLTSTQMNNIKFGIPQANFQISNSSFSTGNESYKEFDTLGRRRPYSANVAFEHDNSHAPNPAERL